MSDFLVVGAFIIDVSKIVMVQRDAGFLKVWILTQTEHLVFSGSEAEAIWDRLVHLSEF